MLKGTILLKVATMGGLLLLTVEAHAAEAPKSIDEKPKEIEANATSTTVDNVAKSAAPSAEESSSSCSSARRLDGAPADPQTMDVSFNQDWFPVLHEVAECLQKPEFASACVWVQGQYDELTFADAIVRALGSQHAAQVYRARGRADRVISELYALGVPPDRIVATPPPVGPTYRGVELLIRPNCKAPPPAAQEETRRIEAPEPNASTRATDPPPLIPSAEITPVRTRLPLKPWWLEAGVVGGAMVVNPNDVYYFAARPAIGWSKNWYGRGFLGFSIGDNHEQRVGFEWGLAGGYVLTERLQVGAIGSHRIASRRPAKAWLEQSWSLGIEVAERLLRVGTTTLWLSESLWPLSFRKQRAVYRNGTLVDIDDRTNYAPRLELSLAIRAHVL
jgi:hypothetical protein